MKLIYSDKVLTAKSVAASTIVDSDMISVTQQAANGQFAIAYELTGTGTATFEYLLSYDGIYFFEPSGATDIATGITTASGSADGKIRSVAFTSGGVAQPLEKNILVGATSGAYATIYTTPAATTGTYAGGDAAGTLYVTHQVGTFQAENLNCTDRQNNIMTIGGNTAAYMAKDIVTFEPELAPYMKIRVTETGGAAAVVVSIWILHQ